MTAFIRLAFEKRVENGHMDISLHTRGCTSIKITRHECSRLKAKIL